MNICIKIGLVGCGEMTVVANFSAIKYECCDKACAVTPSQCRCSTRVGYFLLALVVVPTEHYFVVISAGVVAFWCKYAETSACVSLTLLAQSCIIPYCINVSYCWLRMYTVIFACVKYSLYSCRRSD